MNNSPQLLLGIDTSNYTTSLGLMAEDATLVWENRQILNVGQGQKGLRQSEALFQHVKNLPVLLEDLQEGVPQFGQALAAICVSAKPRPKADSYMPVFLPGLGLARSLAATLGVPLYTTTHQENHIWAGLYSAKGPRCPQFLALHISGGTSELVKVTVSPGYQLELHGYGESLDLHAGQLIDRVGVKLGLAFPAGPHLERLALTTDQDLKIPSFHREGQLSYSGVYSWVLRNLEYEPAILARSVLLSIARSLRKMLGWAVDQTGLRDILVIGGVASNELIRSYLRAHLTQARLYFATPQLSVDNPVGTTVSGGIAHFGATFYGNIFSPNRIDFRQKGE